MKEYMDEHVEEAMNIEKARRVQSDNADMYGHKDDTSSLDVPAFWNTARANITRAHVNL